MQHAYRESWIPLAAMIALAGLLAANMALSRSQSDILDQFPPIGRDFDNPVHDPSRAQNRVSVVDRVRDYDFTRLNDVVGSLQEMDRQQTLRKLFERITAGVTSDKEKHLALIAFLDGRLLASTSFQPMTPRDEPVFDPVVLLKLGHGRCGHAAALAADLALAGGMPARRVLLDGHIVAELYYDGKWHFIDMDGLAGGDTILINGEVPSVADLSHRPELLDALPSHIRLDWPAVRRPESMPYPSYHWFSESFPGRDKTVRYQNKKKSFSDSFDLKHGWRTHNAPPRPANDIRRSPIPPRYLPGAPGWLSVTIKNSVAQLDWTDSEDRDSDVIGYRVYVSPEPRGWNYASFKGPNEIKDLWTGNGSWEADDYNLLFQEPPGQVVYTADSELELKLDGPVFVTIMPFDSHGETVGRRIYRASEELLISPPK